MIKNKNNFFAFTLAEVLITLGIIGIVAAMTIPTLISNYQKKQFETKFAKTYSTIMNGFRLYLADQYCSTSVCSPIQDYYVEAFSGKYDNIDNVFNTAFKVSKTCRGKAEINGCLAEKLYGIDGEELDLSTNAEPYSTVFPDGSALTAIGGVYGALLLLLDTNATAEPNMYGKDLFLFVMDFSETRSTHLPVMFAWGDTNSGPGWWTPWTEDASMCGKPGEKITESDYSNGMGCGARLLEEGFKINYY